MEQTTVTRNRKTVKLDGQRLRDERESRDAVGADRRKKFTQQDMAEMIGIGLATYQKAEAGECIDESIALRIADRLELEAAEIGLLPCNAPPPPKTDRYLDRLHKDNSRIDIRGLLVGSGNAPSLPISEVYIPLRAAGGGVREKDKEGVAGPESLRSISLDEMLRHRKLVIVGDPGGGKSTYLKKLAYEQSGSGATQFPILVRIFVLEEFIHNRVHGGAPDVPEADSADWIPRFLEERSKEFDWGLDVDFFRRKLRERSTLILLDGLDEVPNSARREAIARLFERATKAYRDARFVVTTRPASYEGKSTLDEFETVRIGELDKDAVEGFLDRWAGFLYAGDRAKAIAHRTGLVDALKARPDIRKMARNPLMLTALAVIQYNNRKLPEQRADLYESILKWLSEAHNYPNRPHGGTCLSIFGTLALGMQSYPGGRVKQIERAEAARLIKGEFDSVPEERREAAAREFLEKEFIDSGIVASRGSSLEFWHLTFQEYLAARACDDLDPGKVLFTDDRWLLNEWREVVLLVPGVLIGKGKKRVNAVFGAMLDRVAGDSASLAVKARVAGLMGGALADLRPSNILPDNPSWYTLPHEDEARYKGLLAELDGIFDKDRGGGIDLKVRVEAAEALGQAGDPRLKTDNWVTIPGGKFLMGAQKTRAGKPGYDEEAQDNEPLHEVSEETFQMGRYPVTVQKFAAFLDDEGETGYRAVVGKTAPDNWDEQAMHPNRPVVYVTWFAADAYCKWAGGRLPTEEEWEYAARGREGRKYPWGDTPPDADHANYRECNIGAASPVGLFPAGATPEGLDDMAGNVFEWTNSWYDKEKKYRVVRGGSWDYDPWYLRAAYRVRVEPGDRDDVIGFRCVREA